MKYLAAAQTDVGTVKDINQDSLTLKIAETNCGEVVLAVVCDGMGGLKQGEVASASVVNAFQDWFYNVLPQSIKNGTLDEDIQAMWIDIIFKENNKIMEYAARQKVSMGTTVTAMLIANDRYYILHIGDCRIYEISDKICQLTKDQTFIAREVEQGRMTLEQAKTDERRNILLQCVGVNRQINPMLFSGSVKSNSSYLICTDGFRHEIHEDEIFKYCNPSINYNNADMNQNLLYLIRLNKDRGERDNISAAMIRSCDNVS